VPRRIQSPQEEPLLDLSPTAHTLVPLLPGHSVLGPSTVPSTHSLYSYVSPDSLRPTTRPPSPTERTTLRGKEWPNSRQSSPWTGNE
jgi:hypothetical protein